MIFLKTQNGLIDWFAYLSISFALSALSMPSILFSFSMSAGSSSTIWHACGL